MVRLLIIADDFTGALDTGVQLAASGAKTLVITDPSAEWGLADGTEAATGTGATDGTEAATGTGAADRTVAANGTATDRTVTADETEVLVIDAETRHLPPEKAGETVRNLTAKAVARNIPHIYKKTDSALRGNIGAELTALLEAAGEQELAFLPAYPQINRNTVGGVHYIDGVPVTQSVFGEDPYEPVVHSRIAELIAGQSAVPVHSVAVDAMALDKGPGIYVFDSGTPQDLKTAGSFLARMGKLHILAGCAGFGAVLPELLQLKRSSGTEKPNLDERLLVVCGSMNPITSAQMEAADQAGFVHWRLSPRQKLQPGYWNTEASRRTVAELLQLLKNHESVIIDSNDAGGNRVTAQYAADHGLGPEDIRTGVSRSIGKIVGELFTSEDLGTLLITGGDTLMQCMNEMGVSKMEPVCEMRPGVVLSRFWYKGRCRHVISKSGGFGDRTLFTKLKDMLRKQTINSSYTRRNENEIS